MSVGTKSMPQNALCAFPKYRSNFVLQYIQLGLNLVLITIIMISPMRIIPRPRIGRGQLTLTYISPRLVPSYEADDYELVGELFLSSFRHLMGLPTFSRLSNNFCNSIWLCLALCVSMGSYKYATINACSLISLFAAILILKCVAIKYIFLLLLRNWNRLNP